MIMDLKTVLAQNLKNARNSLQITQIKLAERAKISLSYLVDIERRRTWVSDKTLQSLARALHVEPWELLIPGAGQIEGKSGKMEKWKRIADLINKKKKFLRNTAEEAMEDLIMELLSEASK